MKRFCWSALTCVVAAIALAPTAGAQVVYSNSVTTLMAMASRPTAPGKQGIETADDFVLGAHTLITGGSFTGLIPVNATFGDILGITVSIYQVFPVSSTNPPSGQVPTRVNSPSDAALMSASGSSVTFTPTLLSSSLTALNSVRDGINASPNQRTGGDGSVTGQEVRFDFSLVTPFDLAADHYFFSAQVAMSSGDFYWLSGTSPITGVGNTPISPDLQAWIRNDALDPNWLRVGTDIVGGQTPPTYNAAFTLNGVPATTVPEPASVVMMALGLSGLALVARRRKRA